MPAGWLARRHCGPAPSPQSWLESKMEKYQLFPSLLVSLSHSLISSVCRLLSSHLRSSGTCAPAPTSFSPGLTKKTEACCLRKYSTYSKECFKRGVTGWKVGSCCLVSAYVPSLVLPCPGQATAQLLAVLVCSSRCSSGQMGPLDMGFLQTSRPCLNQSGLSLDRISV